MTNALLAYLPRIVAFPRPEMVPPLIAVVLVPRVGGLGTIFFQEKHLGTQARVQSSHRGLAEVLKVYAKPLAIMPHAGGVGTRERCWQKRPSCRDGPGVPYCLETATV